LNLVIFSKFWPAISRAFTLISAPTYTSLLCDGFHFILLPPTLLTTSCFFADTYWLFRAQVDGGISNQALAKGKGRGSMKFMSAYVVTTQLVATAARAKGELVSFDKGIAAFKDARLFPLNSLYKSRGQN
jgi:hypothetical protein